LKFNRKVEVIFSEEDKQILHSQSKICNWLYNQLLELCKYDYYENNNKNKLLSGRNLRNQVPRLKEDYPFLKTVHSSVTKNTALRLKEAYKKFFKEDDINPPKFRAWKKKWFSLYYDEPNKGFKVFDNNRLQISLGVNKENQRLQVTGKLKEPLNLRPNDKIQTFRLCKQQGGRFYAVFTIERQPIKEQSQNYSRWVAIDPNHKNFFTAIDYQGNSFEFKKLPQLKYWDKIIDKLKSKRDKALRKAKKRKSKGDKVYFLTSKRWERLNEALDKAYHRRREQIKQAMYAIANDLAKRYDYVAIGNYTPSTDTAIYDNMHRSMLNQEVIGQFRNILIWVFERSNKRGAVVDEKNTTKECCICGHEEKKEPEVRKFICAKCGTNLSRDINSAVNIAKKDNLLPGSGHIDWDLTQPMCIVGWNCRSCKIIKTEISSMGMSA